VTDDFSLAPRAATSLAAALAAPRAPFVGRASDVEAVERWLDEGERLVTITGPAGIGKTRVALEVARTSDVASCVVWVDLASASSEAEISDAVRRAAGVVAEDGAGDAMRAIGRALRARGDVLLVLDGLGGGNAHAWLAALLVDAPELFVVVASRERTRIAGEVVHELPALPEAEALFIACAQRIRAGFQPEPEREAIAAIARELEGVPLAIELAAARLSVMGPRALLHRIRSGAPGIGDALERALAGSWSSLYAEEQRALAFSSAFRGGFDLEAAEAVLDGTRPAIDLVGSLRDKSLLAGRAEANGDVRLDLYGALRAFAARKLAEMPGARAAAESRHAAYYSDLAARLRVARDDRSRARLVVERDNLLVVVERVTRASGAEHGASVATVSARAAEPALRALLALAPLLFSHGPLRAWEVVVDPAIAKTRGSGADPALVAEVLLVRGALRRHRGAATEGARDLVNALGLAKTLGSTPLEARATTELGLALEDAGDFAAAEDHHRRAAALFARACDPLEEGRSLSRLASLHVRMSRPDLAREPLERALALHSGDHDSRDERVEDLLVKSAMELFEMRVADARATAEACLALALPRGEGRSTALARMQLGDIALRGGDRVRARAFFEDAAAAFAEHGFGALAAIAGARLGALAKDEGRIAESQLRLRESRDALVALGRTNEVPPIEALLRDLDAPDSSRPALPDDALLVATEAAWFRPPRGERVGLERRRPLARITERLAVERTERPGAPVSSRALQEAAWPGEKIAAAAGAHRVRVAISSLRKVGLPVVTNVEGYALDATIPLVRA
jgi:predicted ATPase